MNPTREDAALSQSCVSKSQQTFHVWIDGNVPIKPVKFSPTSHARVSTGSSSGDWDPLEAGWRQVASINVC